MSTPRPVDLEGPWERSVLQGDLGGVNPRKQLSRLRDVVAAAAAADMDLELLFRSLEGRDPIALADLTVGPRAPRGPHLVRAAMAVVSTLEGQLSAGGLYRRLAVLAGPDAPEVLALAAQRHPAASWLVALSDASGEPFPGLTHLCAAAGHPAFARACWDHAAAGHGEGLVQAAERTGRPETVAALLAHDSIEPAVLAAVRLLESPSEAPLAPYVAAVWGPDTDAFWIRTVSGLRSARALDRLAAIARDCPRTQRLVAASRRGIRR